MGSCSTPAEKVSKLTVACITLHNLCTVGGLLQPDEQPEQEQEPEPEPVEQLERESAAAGCGSQGAAEQHYVDTVSSSAIV